MLLHNEGDYVWVWFPKGDKGNYHQQCVEVSWKQFKTREVLDVLMQVSVLSSGKCFLFLHFYFL